MRTYKNQDNKLIFECGIGQAVVQLEHETLFSEIKDEVDPQTKLKKVTFTSIKGNRFEFYETEHGRRAQIFSNDKPCSEKYMNIEVSRHIKEWENASEEERDSLMTCYEVKENNEIVFRPNAKASLIEERILLVLFGMIVDIESSDFPLTDKLMSEFLQQ